jgi:hypothetical protein
MSKPGLRVKDERAAKDLVDSVFGDRAAAKYDHVLSEDVERFVANVELMDLVYEQYAANLSEVEEIVRDVVRQALEMDDELDAELAYNLEMSKASHFIMQKMYLDNPSMTLAWLIYNRRWYEMHKVLVNSALGGNYIMACEDVEVMREV